MRVIYDAHHSSLHIVLREQKQQLTLKQSLINPIMNKIRIIFMVIALVAFTIAAATAQRSERQIKNGRDDYRNRVPIEIPKIESFGEPRPLHHLNGVEIGGKTATLSLVNPQTQSYLRAGDKRELKRNTANQGISIWVPDTSSMLYVLQKFFSLHVKYNGVEFPFDARFHMSVSEDSTQMASHNMYRITDSTGVPYVGFLITHYPSLSEQENMVRKYKTEITNFLMKKEDARVRGMRGQVQSTKDEIFRNQTTILYLNPELEAKEDRSEVKQERDSLERANKVLEKRIKKAESFLMVHTQELDSKVAVYVKSYEKHLCDFFAYGGVIFDGIELKPESELVPQGSTTADHMVAVPLQGDQAYQAAGGSKLKQGDRVNYGGQQWVVQGRTCVAIGAGAVGIGGNMAGGAVYYGNGSGVGYQQNPHTGGYWDNRGNFIPAGGTGVNQVPNGNRQNAVNATQSQFLQGRSATQ